MSAAFRFSPLLCVAMCAVSEPSGASCGRAAPILVLPWGDSAPVNSRIVVKLDARWHSRGGCDPVDAACPVGDWSLALGPAPAPGLPDADVALDVSETHEAAFSTVVATPRAPLAAHARHEIRLVDRSATHRERLIGTFVTSDLVDRSPPAWGGILQAIVTSDANPPPASRGKILIVDMSGCPAATVTLSVQVATDTETPAPEILYGAWVSADGGTLDYTRPPRILTAGWLDRLRGGGVARSLPLGSDDPTQSDLDVPKGARKLHVGIRPVDAAGNLGPAGEVDVSLP